MTQVIIKAIKDSIKHWEDDIVKPLKEGRKIKHGSTLIWQDTQEPIPCFTSHCPLCHAVGFGCSLCPLVHCGLPGYPWYTFIHNPRLKTAQAMVDKLKSLLPKEKPCK